MKKELTPGMKNVLAALAQITIIQRGRNAGQVKSRTLAEAYDGRTVNALQRRGLINLRWDTVNGDGYAVTPEGLAILRSRGVR